MGFRENCIMYAKEVSASDASRFSEQWSSEMYYEMKIHYKF